MNHRELVLSAMKKVRFTFLNLPEELQDEIVEGLDLRTLTLREASALVESRLPGDKGLSHEAIARYYRALRRERRLFEIDEDLARVIVKFAGQPRNRSLQGLAGLIIAKAAAGIANGTVPIHGINIERMLKTLTEVAPVQQPGRGGNAGRNKSGSQADVGAMLAEAVDRRLGVRK